MALPSRAGPNHCPNNDRTGRTRAKDERLLWKSLKNAKLSYQMDQPLEISNQNVVPISYDPSARICGDVVQP